MFFVHPRSEAELYPLAPWIEKAGGDSKIYKSYKNGDVNGAAC